MFNKKKIQQLERENSDLKSEVKDLKRNIKEKEIENWKILNPPKFEKGQKVDVLLITEVKFEPRDLMKAVISNAKLKYSFLFPFPVIPSLATLKEINKSPYAHHHWKYEIVDTTNGNKTWVTEDELKQGYSK